MSANWTEYGLNSDEVVLTTSFFHFKRPQSTLLVEVDRRYLNPMPGDALLPACVEHLLIQAGMSLSLIRVG